MLISDSMTRRLTLCAFLSALLCIACGEPVSAPAQDEASKVPDRKTLEKQFAQKMSGVVLVGAFTVDGQALDKPPTRERYTITKVTKLAGDAWQFETRVQYGKTDVALPMVIDVLWAGDTPVITLTDLTIPNLGTFSSRVVIHGDRYAGTWQHGKVGGHLWGQLEKLKPEENGPKENGKEPGKANEKSAKEAPAKKE